MDAQIIPNVSILEALIDRTFAVLRICYLFIMILLSII